MIFKTVKVHKPKQLRASWTVEMQPGEMEFGNDLEEELAKTLREEQDWEIMSFNLIELGWTKIVIPENSNTLNVYHWTEQNISGRNVHLRNQWLFENKEDAIIFRLRWS